MKGASTVERGWVMDGRGCIANNSVFTRETYMYGEICTAGVKSRLLNIVGRLQIR